MYVVLTHGPAFALEGTVHHLARTGHDTSALQTRCGLTLTNTDAAATVVLTKRPRRLALCQRCRR